MVRVFLLIGFLFVFLYLNRGPLENYDGYDAKRFLHCSESRKLQHWDEVSDSHYEGNGANNNYFIDETDITYTGGNGDFSKFMDVYGLRKNPETLQAPICMQKKHFPNSLNIPSFFRDIFLEGDSPEILKVEDSYKNILYDPFYKHRDAQNIKNKLILSDKTNEMILDQHAGVGEATPHNNHIEFKKFHKTCSKHDSLGIPFQCGMRKFNEKNAHKQCEDSSVGADNKVNDKDCNKICCKNN